MWKEKEWMVVFLLFGWWITIVSCSTSSNKNVIFHPPSSSSLMVVVSLRNGGTSDDMNGGGSLKQKRKRRKKKRTTTTGNKDVWEESLKKKDSSLGDAIRQRADILQKDTTTTTTMTPFQQQSFKLQQVDASLYSLRWGLGCSSPSVHHSGGVEVSFSAVLAQYFLSSHGGTHGIQCLLSFLAVLFSLSSTMTWNIILLKRTFMCGMMKHASSLLASAILSAQRIPIHGFRNTRTLLHHHPLSQYLFYNSLWILYLNTATTTTTKLPKYIHIAIVGPVLIRELISTLLVLTDIWVLYQGTQKTTTTTTSLTLLSSMKYQTKLAKFVNQISTIFEYMTAMYMSKQTLTSLQHLLLATSNHPKQPSTTTTSSRSSSSIKDVVLQLICTKLYLAYIYTKQKHNKQQPPPTTTTTTDNSTHDKKKKKKGMKK